MTVAFRDATAKDAAAIDHVFRTSFCETFAHLYRDQDLQAFLSTFTPEAWAQELGSPDYAFRLAFDEGVVGYAKLGPPALPVEADGPALELRQLYILKRAHRAGIGRVLTEWALDEARRRGAGELYLTVYTENHRARALYARFGFEEVGPYAFMVGEQPDEDIIMQVRL